MHSFRFGNAARPSFAFAALPAAGGLRTLALALLAICCAFATPSAAGESVLPDAGALAVLAGAGDGQGNRLISPVGIDGIVALARAGFAPPGAPPAVAGLSQALWLNEGITLSAEARGNLHASDRIAATTLDLAGSGRAAVNRWAEAASDGRIGVLLDRDPTGVDLLLTTVLVYAGKWRTGFDPRETRAGAFRLADGTTAEVPLMQVAAPVPCWTTEEGVFARLEFQDGMIALLRLPHASGSAPQAAPGAVVPAIVVLPRLSLAQRTEVTGLLARLGREAELREGLLHLAETPLVLGPVVQALRLELDETGVDLAAATAAMATRALPDTLPTLIRFDRPFELFVIDPASGATLLAAHVADPRGKM